MDNVIFENYEPGNGTRYVLILVKTKKGLLLTWLRNASIGGVSFLFREGVADFDIWTGREYFMEKTGIDNKADAQALIDRAIMYLLGS